MTRIQDLLRVLGFCCVDQAVTKKSLQKILKEIELRWNLGFR